MRTNESPCGKPVQHTYMYNKFRGTCIDIVYCVCYKYPYMLQVSIHATSIHTSYKYPYMLQVSIQYVQSTYTLILTNKRKCSENGLDLLLLQ